MSANVMMNAYPESLGGRLSGLVGFLRNCDGIFDSVYLMPTLYDSDMDGGFSVIEYALNQEVAADDDLRALREMGVALTLDMVLNHLSAL